MSVRFRLEAVARGALDQELACLPRAQLERWDDVLTIECEAEDADRAVVALARAGFRATPDDGVAPRHDLLPAVVGDLEPRLGPRIVDRVALRSVELGDAAAVALPPRLLRWRSRRPEALARARALLHGEDRLFLWRRIAWVDRAVLRSGAMRGARAIVFDREAIARDPERRAWASDGLLARWALR